MTRETEAEMQIVELELSPIPGLISETVSALRLNQREREIMRKAADIVVEARRKVGQQDSSLDNELGRLEHAARDFAEERDWRLDWVGM